MSGIKAHITSNKGTPLTINSEGGILTAQQSYPSLDETRYPIPFRQYFLDSTNSNGMRVNGSTTTVDFSIKASATKDIFIKTISVEIVDAGATLANFGAIASLANGVEFSWFTQEEGKITIHDGIRTSWDFIRLCGGLPAFGDNLTAYKGVNIVGAADGYIPIMDVSSIFGLPWGFRLRKGTTDRLTFSIRDDLTSLNSFNIIGYGIQI